MSDIRKEEIVKFIEEVYNDLFSLKKVLMNTELTTESLRNLFRSKFRVDPHEYHRAVDQIILNVLDWLVIYEQHIRSNTPMDINFILTGINRLHNYLLLTKFYIINTEVLIPLPSLHDRREDVSKLLSERLAKERESIAYLNNIMSKILDCNSKLSNVLTTLTNYINYSKSPLLKQRYRELVNFCKAYSKQR